MRSLLYIFIGLTLSSCLKLDDLAFQPDDSIDKYYLDDYTGKTNNEDMPSSFSVHDSLIHPLTLQSKASNEATATNIKAFYVGDTNTINTDTIIVYCHGQGGHIDFYWPRAKLLAGAKNGINTFGVLVMDYKGFGLSDGKPTENGLSTDVATCLQWLKSKGAKSNNIIIYGFSMGSVPATNLAGTYDSFKPAKLILEGPLASSDNLAQESTLINFPSGFLTTVKFNNVEAIKKVQQPLMWIHGIEDDYIAITNGELIYKNYSGTYSEAHRIPYAKHNKDGVPQTMGYQSYLDMVYGFIRK